MIIGFGTDTERLRREQCQRVVSQDLQAVLSGLRKGDILVVVRLADLNLKLPELVSALAELLRQGRHLRVLEQAIYTDGPLGEEVRLLLNGFNEVNQAVTLTRRMRALSKASGGGRPLGAPKEQIMAVLERHLAGQLTQAQAARELGVSHTSIRRYKERWFSGKFG